MKEKVILALICSIIHSCLSPPPALSLGALYSYNELQVDKQSEESQSSGTDEQLEAPSFSNKN